MPYFSEFIGLTGACVRGYRSMDDSYHFKVSPQHEGQLPHGCIDGVFLQLTFQTLL